MNKRVVIVLDTKEFAGIYKNNAIEITESCGLIGCTWLQTAASQAKIFWTDQDNSDQNTLLQYGKCVADELKQKIPDSTTNYFVEC